MGTFDEQREVEQVETVRDITRFEQVVTKAGHMIAEDYTEEVDGEDVTKTRMVDDGGPDLDVFNAMSVANGPNTGDRYPGRR